MELTHTTAWRRRPSEEDIFPELSRNSTGPHRTSVVRAVLSPQTHLPSLPPTLPCDKKLPPWAPWTPHWSTQTRTSTYSSHGPRGAGDRGNPPDGQETPARPEGETHPVQTASKPSAASPKWYRRIPRARSSPAKVGMGFWRGLQKGLFYQYSKVCVGSNFLQILLPLLGNFKSCSNNSLIWNKVGNPPRKEEGNRCHSSCVHTRRTYGPL